LFSGPPKGTSLRETASFDVLIVKIGAGVLAVGCRKNQNKMLSYRRETALQGTLVLSESGRLELRDNILLIW